MQGRANLRKVAPLSWCIILLFSIITFSQNAVGAYAGTTVYDFVAHAPDAYWSSGAGILKFPGNSANSSGFACYMYNALLEDGSTWQRVLETHPQWIGSGYIMGAYPQQEVPSNAQLTVRIGFLSGATGTDGARFEVYFDEYRGMNVAPLRHTIFSHLAKLDSKIDLVTEDLGYLAGKKGNFILYVNAGQTSDRDWAVWAEAKLETKALPDLVITDVWEKDGQIRYKVKNIGEASTSAKSFCNCLSVDGKQVAKHCVSQLLQPGQEAEGVFDYAWQPAPGEHVVRVCADCENNVEESNEKNNCLEERWLKENLPDLVIVEVKSDRNNSLIGYVLKNSGGEIAKGGHSTTLYVDGKETTHDLVSIDLSPGETYESWFMDYEWPECHNISVKICADNYNQVKEINEGNNCLEKKCISYPVPIIIVSGPSAINVTQDSVTVVWVTNKKSDSTVRYSERSTGEEKTVYDASIVKDHLMKIIGLKPRTTYRFYVGSKDQCGNAAVSKTMVFETTSPPDEENPSVTLILPERLAGVVDILANASDNVGVAYVMFSMDGVVKFIDFSSPYVWVCNTTMFSNGVHSFDAIAFDAAGNEAIDTKDGMIDNPIPDTNPPIVRITIPSKEWVHDLVEIEAWIEDREYHKIPAGYIQAAELYIDGVLVKAWGYSWLSFDLFTGNIIVNPKRSNLTFTYLWNATGLEPNSEHTIEVKAWDDSGNYGHDSIRVKIFSMMPIGEYLEKIRTGVIKITKIEVTRNVVRHDNWFDVNLTIKNTGNIILRDFMIVDNCKGFQAIALPWPDKSSDTIVVYDPDFLGLPLSQVIIQPLTETLNPGEALAVNYHAVPFLTYPYYWLRDYDYIIGDCTTYVPTTVYFECENAFYSQNFELPYFPVRNDDDRDGVNDLDDAFRSADYLIITNPRGLFIQNNPHDPAGVDSVNLLLQYAAVLAKLKHGVLGYISGPYSPEEIRNHIYGIWSNRLNEAFRHPDIMDAYLLIIGETEVVSSYTYDVTIKWSDGSRTNYVPLSDYYYGTNLIVGRIIGDNARDLLKPIKASIDVYLGYGFDRQTAVFTSGYEDGGCSDFPGEVREAADDASEQIPNRIIIDWRNFVKTEWNIRFTEYDAFALKDLDGDGIDEIIIANDEDQRVYIYTSDGLPWKRAPMGIPCHFTRYDGFALGDVDGDGINEIIIANDEEDLVYIYELNGALKGSWYFEFNQWDQIATGDILHEYMEVSHRDEILRVDHETNYVYVYMLLAREEDNLREADSFDLDLDFTRYDSFAVGNVRNDWKGNEIVVIRDDDQRIYIYKLNTTSYMEITNVERFEIRDLNRCGCMQVRYTPYDGFALGDINEDGNDDIIVVCDEDEKIYRYYWDGTYWCGEAIYSSLLSDWFHGVRYTGSPTRHDGFAVGKLFRLEKPSSVIIRNRNGPTSSFYSLVSTWEEADKLANMRIGQYNTMSILLIFGHGNPLAASPMNVAYDSYWGEFSQHPFVLSLSCLSGNYEDYGDSLGEALFRHGTAVFIGSTQLSACSINSEAARHYFEYWNVWETSAGRAFRDYKSVHSSSGGCWTLWVYEYNYYGDPKFPGG